MMFENIKVAKEYYNSKLNEMQTKINELYDKKFNFQAKSNQIAQIYGAGHNVVHQCDNYINDYDQQIENAETEMENVRKEGESCVKLMMKKNEDGHANKQ